MAQQGHASLAKSMWYGILVEQLPPLIQNQVVVPFPEVGGPDPVESFHIKGCQYVIDSIRKSPLQNERELIQRHPMARLFQLGPQSNDVAATVFDRTTQGWKYAQRVLRPHLNNYRFAETKYTVVQASGHVAQPQELNLTTNRVLIVVDKGWLIYFAPDMPYILTEKQFLVFEDDCAKVIYRRVFDTRHERRNEIFLKITALRKGHQSDGMTIYQAIVQRDTEIDGTYVVTGKANTVLPMTRIMKMIFPDAQAPQLALPAP